MQYHSPLHILNINPGKGEIDRAMLKKARKRLLAEFELQGSITIDLDGQAYDRQSVLQLFESLDQPGWIDHHLRIYQDTLLLRFLEEGHLDWFRQDSSPNYQDDKAFADFLGPYFAYQYNKKLTQFIKSRSLPGIRLLTSVPLPIDERFEHDCFRSTYRTLTGEAKDLENLARKVGKYRIPSSRYAAFLEDKFKLVLNELPDYFQGVRDRIAMAFHDLGLALFNIHQRGREAKKVIRFGLSLKVDSTVRYNLKFVLDQLEEMTNFWGGAKGTGGGSDFSIGWLLIVVFIVARIFMALDDSPSTDYKLSNIPTYNGLEYLGNESFMAFKTNDKLIQHLVSLEQDDKEVPDNFSVVNRPLTGNRPYQDYVEKQRDQAYKSNYYSCNSEIDLHNTSEFDAIVFIEDFFCIKDHLYVRAGDSIQVQPPNMVGSGFFRIVYGEGWSEKQVSLEQDLPGFQFLWGTEELNSILKSVNCPKNGEEKNSYQVKLSGPGEVTQVKKR